MTTEISSLQADRTAANVIQIGSYVFRENTFRARKPREEGVFALAGRIRNRDELKLQLVPLAD